MGAPAKKVNNKMRMTADDLNNVHNSDEHHALYDIYYLFEQKHPEIAKAVQDMIEETFGKHEDIPETAIKTLTEIEFIYKEAMRYAKGQWNKVRKITGDIITAEDIAQKTIEKIIVAGTWNPTVLKEKKIKYIKETTEGARIDLMRSLNTRNERAKELTEFSEAHDPLYKKRIGKIEDSNED